MYTILVLEDDFELNQTVSDSLKKNGYRVLSAYTCKEGQKLAKTYTFNMAILDVNLPDGDGFQFCKWLKARCNSAVLFLSARDLEDDLLDGYDSGADDYVTKPFNPLEVVARVKSQLRRYTMLGAIPEKRASSITIGSIMLDDDSKQVTVDGEPVSLTPIEYNILYLLMRNPDKVFSSAKIYQLVWEDTVYGGSDSTVAVHIRHLREKIEINPAEPRYLKVVWGQGYKFCAH